MVLSVLCVYVCVFVCFVLWYTNAVDNRCSNGVYRTTQHQPRREKGSEAIYTVASSHCIRGDRHKANPPSRREITTRKDHRLAMTGSRTIGMWGKTDHGRHCGVPPRHDREKGTPHRENASRASAPHPGHVSGSVPVSG